MQLGLELVLMGMGTVFTFLILLIFLTTLMSKTIAVFEEKMVQPAAITSPASDNANKMTDEMLSIVIAKAIQQHRSNKKNS